jgi:hypothetical protein
VADERDRFGAPATGRVVLPLSSKNAR